MCIISVTFLGQGVGYSFTQCSMLISGLWGIYCFKEIEGRDRILGWMLSALLAVTGILGLSYEHAHKTTNCPYQFIVLTYFS